MELKQLKPSDKCICGSNKIMSECCWNELLQKQSFYSNKLEEIKELRKRNFGKVRPIIATDHQGKKWVASRNRLFYSGVHYWQYPVDFLIEYVTFVFDEKWGNSEIKKKEEERHPIVQLRAKCIQYLNNHLLRTGKHAITPNGFANAFLTFAYDLFLVEDNSLLDNDLIKRLHIKDQFQGARHELFAESTCIRAGYTIKHENQKDGSTKHTEFIASHEETNIKIAVEAKSKCWSGILGYPGEPVSEDNIRPRFGSIIKDAITKNPNLPLVIFIDLNLPANKAEEYLKPDSRHGGHPKKLTRLLDDIRNEHSGKDPYNCLVITNFPYHYGKEDEVTPKGKVATFISYLPKIEIPNVQPLVDIHEAAMKFGNIPNAFNM